LCKGWLREQEVASCKTVEVEGCETKGEEKSLLLHFGLNLVNRIELSTKRLLRTNLSRQLDFTRGARIEAQDNKSSSAPPPFH
jgi:hypothetical protein